MRFHIKQFQQVLVSTTSRQFKEYKKKNEEEGDQPGRKSVLSRKSVKSPMKRDTDSENESEESGNQS